METALYPEDVFSAGGELENNIAKEEISTEKNKEESEKGKIIEALRRAGGKKGMAADLLGMDRSTLWRKIKTYNIE